MFEELDQRLVNSIERLVRDAIIENEPRVQLNRVDVASSDAEQGCVSISVSYTVRATNSRFNMVFPFYLLEPTTPIVR
jgi:hypothetical protein